MILRRLAPCVALMALAGIACSPHALSAEPVVATSSDVPAAQYPRTMEKLRETVDSLRQESIEDSLERLCDVSAFFDPGIVFQLDAEGYEVPLPPELGYAEVEQILSNRRVLKLLEDLESLPADQAGVLVSRKIDAALETYLRLFEEKLIATGSLRRPTQPGVAGLSFQISDNPDGAPTLLGQRYGVLSLVLIAGSLRLETARAAVEHVVNEAMRQRTELYALHGEGHPRAHEALTKAGLYNRQVLAIGMLGVAPDAAEAGEATAQSATVKVTSFDAVLTPFDRPVRRFGEDADYSRWSAEVSVYPIVSDERFDALLARFASSAR